jgi:S-DNA-T family DNA segregation ATPase FtsK/SpoIIIE
MRRVDADNSRVTDTATAGNDDKPGGRLVPLPRRTLDDERDRAASPDRSPASAVADLLERTDHLVAQLEGDIAHLREGQGKEQNRIEREAQSRRHEADAAGDRLLELAVRARQIAVQKARGDVLDAALAEPGRLDPTVSFEEVVERIEVELRLSRGITGAIRLGTVGALLNQASLRVDHMVERAGQARSEFLKGTEHELVSEGKEARASYEIGMSVVRRDLRALDVALPPCGLPWDDPRWEQWQDWEPLSGLSRWIRLGTLFRPQLEKFRFPALIELPGDRGVVFDVGAGSRPVAIDAVRSMLVRILAAIPAGEAQFTFIDPVGAGASIAPLLPLGEYRSDLVDDQVYEAEAEIEVKLGEVAAHIDRVGLERLHGGAGTLEHHHEDTVERYRFLTVFDFPEQFTDRSRKLLRTIVETGPRAGVFTIMTTAPGAARSQRSRWKAMLAGLAVVTGDANGFSVDTEAAGRWTIDLDTPTDLVRTLPDGTATLFGRILSSVGERAKQGRDVVVSQVRVFELLADAVALGARDDLPRLTIRGAGSVDPTDRSTWWTGDSAPGLGVPIGRSEGREVTTLWLDSAERSGVLVGGERGSGVSTILHDMILGLSMTYSPDELALHLVDFSLDGSAGFEAYATERLPHARVVALNAERELGVAVLDGLVREMTRRAMLFAPHGGERAGIEGYRRATGDPLARVVVVMDSIERLFVLDDRISDRAAQLIDTLARQGAFHGIHLAVASHSVRDLERLGRHTFDHLRVRIALACSEDDSRLLLGSHNGQASGFGRAGEAVLNLMHGDPQAGRFFQATAMPAFEHGLVLRELRSHADDHGFTRTPQIVEGRAPARLEDSSIRTVADHSTGDDVGVEPRLWLGEPAVVGGPVEVTLHREDGANLLIVGHDQRLGIGVLTAALTSAYLDHGPELDARVVDLMAIESGFAEVVVALGHHRSLRSYRCRNRDEGLDGVIQEIDRRVGEHDCGRAPLLLVVNGLGIGSSPSADTGTGRGLAAALGRGPLSILGRILADGPAVGVHTMVWTDRLASLMTQVSRNALRGFALRVVMTMPAEESALLIDSAHAETLGDNQALLYDERAARLTKFRPYVMPPIEFIESLPGVGVVAGVGAV